MSDGSTQKSSRLKWILPLAIFLLGILVMVSLVKSKPQAPSRPVTEKVWGVKTIPVALGEHRPALVLYGKVETPRMTNITSAVTAFVAEVNTDEGRTMAPDEILIKLDDRDAKLIVDQRQADVANLEAQLEAEKVRHQSDQTALQIQKNLLQLSLNTVKRYENLIKRKVASQEQLDGARKEYQQQRLSVTERERAIADHPNRVSQIESQLLRARSLLETAHLDLSRTEITAPFTGRIAKLNVSPGDRVRAGDSLIQYYSMERLEVRSQMPNRILPLIRSERDVTSIVATGQIDNKQINLTLDRIAAEVNGGTAGVDAFFTLKSNEYLPEPGRSLSIQVSLPPEAKTIPIPPVALYGLDRVYRVADNRLLAVTVQRVGDAFDAQGNPLVLIRSEQLKEGDKIITTQLPNAITGLRVKEVGGDA